MKIKNATFIQRHIEKIAIGSAGLFLMLVLAYYLLNIPALPFGVSLKKSEKKPIGSLSKIIQDQADSLRRKVNASSRVDPENFKPPQYPEILTRLRLLSVVGKARLPVMSGGLADGAMAPGVVANLVYYLPRPPMPMGGRAVAGNVVLASGQDQTYVSVEGSFDQEAWVKRMRDAAKKHPQNQEILNGFMVAQGLNIAGVYLQRERWEPTHKAWVERQSITVDGQVCYRESQPGWDPSTENDKAMSLLKSIKDNQTVICNPGFPALDKSSPGPALQADKDKTAVEVVDDSGALPDKGRLKEKELPAIRVWSHDLTVEPGQRYHYRLVASVVNPLYGVPASSLDPHQADENKTRLALEPDAKEMAAAQWTEISLPANFYNFLVEASGNRVKFEVWKVVNGNWVTQTFEAKVGDAIGSANALVAFPDGTTKPVDLDTHKILVNILEAPDPDHPERKVKAVLLMDSAGQLKMRYVNADLNSVERQQVLNKAQGSVPGAAGTPN